MRLHLNLNLRQAKPDPWRPTMNVSRARCVADMAARNRQFARELADRLDGHLWPMSSQLEPIDDCTVGASAIAGCGRVLLRYSPTKQMN